MATLTLTDWSVSYWPFGLVAARMVQRVLSLQTKPAWEERGREGRGRGKGGEG